MPKTAWANYRSIPIMILFAFLAPTASAALSLPEVEKLAMEQDPTLSRLQAESQALQEQAVADGQWKDPRMKLGLTAIPLDSFDLRQEPMTQQQFGLQQAFPRGNSLAIKQKHTHNKVTGKAYQSDAERRKIRRDARLAFLDIVYQRRARGTVSKSKRFLAQLVEIAQFRYASGKEKQQKILEASLAHARVEDRLLIIRKDEEVSRAKLAQWIGWERAHEPLTSAFPKFDISSDDQLMQDQLSQHPLLQLSENEIQAQQLDMEQAQEQYKPAWMVDATYGLRRGDNPNNSARTDFASVMVSMDLPLFTANRQDRIKSARMNQRDAARYKRDEQLRMLKTQLDIHTASSARIKDRLRLIASKLMPDAKNYTQSTLAGYQNGVTDLTDVVRAHITELETRLDKLKLQRDLLTTQAKLLYLIGEKG